MFGDFDMSHARAACAEVRPRGLPNSLSISTMRRFARIASGWKRGRSRRLSLPLKREYSFISPPPVKTAVYRAVRYESYPEFAACGKHAVIFDCAVHQVVFALYCGYRADCVRASDCGSSHFAHSEFQDFPLLYELSDGFGYGFRRGFGIGAVLVKYADCLDAQTP